MPIDYLVTDTELSDIADAIRAKGGTSASISFPNGFTTAIAAIPTGITPTGTKQISITQNGTITEDVTNYANAEIAVDVSGGGVDLQDVTIENNDADALYYTDASMTVHSVTSGTKDLYNEPLPVGSLIVSVRTGVAPPIPLPMNTIGINQIASYTVGSKGTVRIYEVIPRS